MIRSVAPCGDGVNGIVVRLACWSFAGWYRRSLVYHRNQTGKIDCLDRLHYELISEGRRFPTVLLVNKLPESIK